jgi:hypothetical protein
VTLLAEQVGTTGGMHRVALLQKAHDQVMQLLRQLYLNGHTTSLVMWHDKAESALRVLQPVALALSVSAVPVQAGALRIWHLHRKPRRSSSVVRFLACSDGSKVMPDHVSCTCMLTWMDIRQLALNGGR